MRMPQFQAEAGDTLKPQRAPVINGFVPRFLEWVDKAMLEPKTKADYNYRKSV